MEKKDISNMVGRLQPQDVELEEVVLGALMIDREAINAVIDILQPDFFYKPAHQEIYKAIEELFANSQPIDMLTVTQQLKQVGALEMAGGPMGVSALTTLVNSAANIEFHARVIVEQAIKREIIRIAINIQKDAFDETIDIFDLLDQAQQSIFHISENSIRKNYSIVSNLLRQAITELEEKKYLKNGLTGIPSGFSDLDRLTAGFQKSDLIVVAARPSMGTTSFLLSILRNASVDFNYPIAFFSLKMSEIQIINRLISIEVELESDKLKKGILADYEWQQLRQRTIKLGESPIFIDDTPALSLLELRAKCRRLKAQHDIQMIIIDGLPQLDYKKNKNSNLNREQEVSMIIRNIKALSKELNIPIIISCEVNRQVETRGGDKKPNLSDLKDSSSVEYEGDTVLFLYRPEYYNITEDMEGNSTKGICEVIVAKNTTGSLDTIKLRFVGKYGKFENLDTFGQTNIETKIVTFSSKANDSQEYANHQTNTSRLDDEPPF